MHGMCMACAWHVHGMCMANHCSPAYLVEHMEAALVLAGGDDARLLEQVVGHLIGVKVRVKVRVRVRVAVRVGVGVRLRLLEQGGSG